MDFSAMLEAVGNVFLLQNIIAIVLGLIVGLIVGSLPGLNGTLAIGILIPFTFGVPLETALLFLASIYVSSNYSGSLASILLGTPGTPAAAATLFDGYQLAKRGQALKAIDMALYASVSGGIAADVFLLILVVPLTYLALKFGPPEVLILIVVALISISTISEGRRHNLFKNIISGLIGIFLATIGLDPIRGASRYVFGNAELLSGISMLIVVIGLLCLPEVIIQIAKIRNVKINYAVKEVESQERLTFGEYVRALPTIAKGIVIGTIVGIMPGSGPTMAAFLSYQAEYTASANRKDNPRVGEGSLLGVAAPESANNAVAGANLIPLFAFGIPGDTAAAIMIGAFIMHGVTPGPLIMARIPEVVYTVIFGLLIANFVLLILAKTYNVVFKYIVSLLRPTVLYPLIIMIALGAAYTVNRSMLDLFLVVVIGFLGVLVISAGLSRASMIIGLVLGGLGEKALGQTLTMGHGSLLIFFTRPLSFIMLAGIIFYFAVSIARKRMQGKRNVNTV